MKIEYCKYINCDDFDCQNCQIDELIKELRPQAKWIRYNSILSCSLCNCSVSRLLPDCIGYGDLNYCPNCGAQMKGDNDNG